MYNINDSEELLKKNKPRLFFPIVSTVFALFIMVALTVLMIMGQIKWYFGLIGYFIFIAFAFSTWYNGYISKKKNILKIKNYNEETNVIVNYVKRYKDSIAVKVGPNEHIFVTAKELDKVPNISFKYNQKLYSFGAHEQDKILISFGVSFAGIEVEPKTNKVVSVAGVLPISIWLYKKLKAPIAKPASLYVDFNGVNPNPKVVVQYMHKEDFYYDVKTGWLMVGERKQTPLDEAYQIAENVIIVLREKEITSLWIKVEEGIKI